MKLQKPIKERANKIYVRFKSLLSPQSLNSLSTDTTFTGRFSGVDIIKHNENVIGIHLIDKNKIDYFLNIERIEAFSTFQQDNVVKKELELLAKGLLNRLGRDPKDFEIDDQVRHEIIKIDLNKIIKPELIENLRKIFTKNEYDGPETILIKFLAKKKRKLVNIQFHYPSSKYNEEKRAVVEANEELIKDIVRLLK